MISNKNRIDYNLIAGTYNKRYDYDKHNAISNLLNKSIETHGSKSVVEIGAGTCYWLKNIHGNVFRTRVDISLKMLQTAGLNPEGINRVNADAAYLPFKSGAVDFVFCVNALHHFKDKLKFFGEANTVLRSGRLISIFTFDPRTKGDHWYLYDYFDGVYEFDLKRFLPIEQIAEFLSAAGFGKILKRTAEVVYDNKNEKNVLKDPFLQKHGSSQMVMLSEEEYRQGINKIKEKIRIAKAGKEELSFPVKLTMFEISGIKI